VALVIVLVVAVGFLTMRTQRSEVRGGRVSHFTIPILSPFTSVVGLYLSNFCQCS
jgi:hypothetical protein